MTTTGDPTLDDRISELRKAEDDRIQRIIAAKIKPLEARIADLERRMGSWREVEE